PARRAARGEGSGRLPEVPRSALCRLGQGPRAHDARGADAGPTVYSLEERLKALEVPTLIVTGDEDEPCLEPGLFMKRKIPTSALVVLPKSGHAVNLEEPEAFNRAVLDFLTAVAAGRWPRRRAA